MNGSNTGETQRVQGFLLNLGKTKLEVRQRTEHSPASVVRFSAFPHGTLRCWFNIGEGQPKQLRVFHVVRGVDSVPAHYIYWGSDHSLPDDTMYHLFEEPQESST